MTTCNTTQRDRTLPRPTPFEIDNLEPGMAYVPWQYLENVFDIDKALECGTIFPELYKPFIGKRGNRP